MKSKKLEKKTIEKIMLKHNLGEITNIEYSNRGMVNLCIFINDKYVLRINNRDCHINKFLREKTVLDFLYKKNVTVPKSILYDNDCDIIPYEYIISKKEKGKEIREYLLNTNIEKRKKILIDAGKLLGELHKFKFKKFGNINQNFGNCELWEEFILERVKEDINICKKMEIFKPKILEIILEIFEKNINLFKKIEESNIIHYDFNFTNLIINEDNIISVFDFEWTRLGDKNFDFVILEIEEFTENPKFKKWFYEGYNVTNKISENFENLFKFYKLLYLLEISIPINLHRPKSAQIWVKEEIIKLIKEIK